METKIKEKLELLEEQLEKISKASPKTATGKKKQESESNSLKERIERLKKFSQFSAGERVSKGEQLGRIVQLSFSPGGMPEVWVKWDDSKPLSPESPELLSSVSIPPEIVGAEELSPDEERERINLERKIEKALKAFYEAGKALREIRDRRLYRSTHQTFEDYCLDRFNFTRRRPYQLIDAATVIDNLLESGTHDDEMCTNGSQKMLPSAERQIRPLTPLEPDQQREAWQKAVNQSGGKVPTGKVVKSIVDQLRERRPVPNPWKIGDVVTIIPKDNPELKGKAGHWGIITEVNTFSCMVYLYDGHYQTKIENLKELPYTSEQKQQLRELSDRLSDIYSPEMEEIAKSILSTLGKINRPCLTELEKKLLRVLEGKEFDDYSLDELLELQGKIAELINDRQLKEK